MPDSAHKFIPAAGRDWALPLYDPLVKLMGGDRARRTLLDLAAPRPGQAVLDIGCGTGTLAVLVKRAHPAVEVVGLDPDPRALARARGKAGRAALSIRFELGFADALPFPDASFDRVVSSFVYHHLGAADKDAMLKEARRVLKPGGILVLLDFEGPQAAAEGSRARGLHRSAVLADNDPDRILGALRQAGFEDARRAGRGSLVFGLVAYSFFLGAARPAAGPSEVEHEAQGARFARV